MGDCGCPKIRPRTTYLILGEDTQRRRAIVVQRKSVVLEWKEEWRRRMKRFQRRSRIDCAEANLGPGTAYTSHRAILSRGNKKLSLFFSCQNVEKKLVSKSTYCHTHTGARPEVNKNCEDETRIHINQQLASAAESPLTCYVQQPLSWSHSFSTTSIYD